MLRLASEARIVPMKTQEHILSAKSATERRAQTVPPDHAAHEAVIARATVRLPIHFFLLSVLWFTCGSVLLPWLAPGAIRFFYQTSVLSLTHIFTLGFISSAIMGVMYRYVPALVRRPVPYPRIAVLQFAAYEIGIVGMVAHFAIDNWTGLWWSAALVLTSVVLFALNLLPLLWSGVGRGVAETGMFAATCFLLLAGSLGLLMGIEEARGFVFGNLVMTLGAHVTFAAIGWVTLAICAASYRFVPAFILPTRPLPEIALWQIVALIVATLGLGISLLLKVPGAGGWGLAVAGALLGYVVVMATLVTSRRMPTDWAIGHALAGMLWLIAALILGLAVLHFGAWSAKGSRLSGALTTTALLGWVANFIIGMSYRLFPGFVARARTSLGFPALTISELSIERGRPFILVALNTGASAIIAAFLLRAPALGSVGGCLVLISALPYTATTCWTLSFAYRA
jgi:hypothetical protein